VAQTAERNDMKVTKADKKRLKTMAKTTGYDIEVFTNHLIRAAKEIGQWPADLLLFIDETIPPPGINKNSFLEFFYWNLDWSEMPYHWAPRKVYERLGGTRR
jgi:hypothetical protein